MWMIRINQNGEKAIPDQDNPKYYLCKRFFTTEKYKAFSQLPIEEVVSVDSMLFPEKTLLDKETATKYTLSGEEQLLCVYCIENNITFTMEEITGFEFCGFDLAEEFEISALTNCGGFDETFTYKDLNMLGLIPDFLSAKRIQTDLAINNPNEEHADCLLFAVWRKI